MLTMESFHFSPGYVIYTSVTHSNTFSEQLICFYGNTEAGRDKAGWAYLGRQPVLREQK